MLSFIKSERSKPKLSYGGFLYNYHREKSSGSITWRCEMNSKHYRDLGISCSSTASTTGTFPTSTLEWARDHTHPPDNSKIKARGICQDVKERAIMEPTYFEPTWIGVTVGRRSGRRTAPIFPLAMWNVHGRHFTGTTRTTNALEAFHHAFNSLLSCKHPTIWVLLKAIHRQQALTDNTLAHIARGSRSLSQPSRLLAMQG